MTPAAFVQREKGKYEIFEWILALVPPESTGSNLRKFPPWLEQQLRVLGIDPTSPRRALASFSKIDWAKDAYVRVVTFLPPDLAERLKLSEHLVVACVPDAEFNGRVYQCKNGHAIVVPSGAVSLASYAAELWTLHASPAFSETLILADHLVCKWHEPYSYRLIRSARQQKNLEALRSTYPEYIGGELEFLFKTYVDLGVANPPDLIMNRIPPMPLFPDPGRPGHPLETGSHLREWGLRFLLLHECGHIMLDRFAEAQSIQEEFDADTCAFEMGLKSSSSEKAAVASVVGAWLVLAVARRIEQLDNGGSRTTHPPAEARLERLWAFTRTTDLLGRSSRAAALAHLQEAESREEEFVRASKDYRRWKSTQGNSISSFLRQCIKEGRLPDFMGQVFRWILFGAPSRLCSALAAARVEFERQLKANAKDEEAQAALTAIKQIYDAADKRAASNLHSKLQEEYWAHSN